MNELLIDGSEGTTPLDPEEAEGLLAPHVQTREQLNELENANIVQGQSWLARKRVRDLLKESFPRLLHKRLFGEVWAWAGTFRSEAKSFGVPPERISADLHNLIEDTKLCKEHKVYPPLEIAARFHRRLLSIHPFPDGNRRYARVMTDALLTKLLRHPAAQWGGSLPTDPVKRREEYELALSEANDEDYERLLRFLRG